MQLFLRDNCSCCEWVGSPHRGPASDKPDNDLFVVSSQPSSVGGRLPGKASIKKCKPLRSEMHLMQTTTLDSSEDDDVTSSGGRILGGKRRSVKGVDSDTSRIPPPQPKINRKPRDLWNDDVDGAEEFEDQHYLKTTRKKLPKVPTYKDVYGRLQDTACALIS